MQVNSIVLFSTKCKYSHQSNCGDAKNALKQLNRLHNSLLCEDDLKISKLVVSRDDLELSISLDFKLSNPEMLDKIVVQFDALTDYLNSISQKWYVAVNSSILL